MRQLGPTAHARCLIALAAASELKFRRREATAALEGSIDAQIVVELAIYGLLGGWLVFSAISRGDRLSRYLPWRFGPALASFAAICVLAYVTSTYAMSVLAIARAVQFTIVAAFVMSAARLVYDDDDALVEFWEALRPALWVLVVASVTLTLILSGVALPTVEGRERYGFLATHPIPTAQILGFLLILVAARWFYRGGPEAPSRWRALRVPGVALVTALLLLTKSRGALAGTVAGLAVIGLLAPNRTRRGVVVLVVLGFTGLALLGFGIHTIEPILTRGRSLSELRTFTGRLELWGIAYDLFLERPLTGYGFQAGRSIFLEAVPWAPGNSHNLVVDVGISMGIPGLVAYGCLILSASASAVGAALSRTPSPRRMVMRQASALLTFSLLAGVVNGGAGYLPGFELLTLLLAALAADVWRRATSQPELLVDPSTRSATARRRSVVV